MLQALPQFPYGLGIVALYVRDPSLPLFDLTAPSWQGLTRGSMVHPMGCLQHIGQNRPCPNLQVRVS